VPDAADKCKFEKGLPKYEGCPDSDADLVPDHLDQCPNEKGDPNNNGCKKDLPDMVFVQGGSFQMGSNDGESDEKPVHPVTLSDFYLHRYEVTVEQFGQFIAATKYQTDADKNGGSYFWENSEWKLKPGINWKYDATGKLRPSSEYNHPVIHVSWNDAIAYCNWRSEQEGLQKVYTISGSTVSANWSANGYRLPTEAEWEYAARSRGKDYKYAWGNGSPKGNIADETAKKTFSDWTIWDGYTDGYLYTAPVDQFEQGDLGLFNMSGNVWEWCWDWYGSYPSAAQNNLRGADTGSYRVLRGGSWDFGPANLRCASRSSGTPGRRNDDIGFRLARAAR
jgi:formylglycine-generating enzyme required for sulfatase activity